MLIISMTVLYVFVQNSADFTNRSMQIIMKRMGHNMLIVPEEADVLAAYQCSDSQMEFPDTVAHFLAGQTQLLSKYYVARLQRKYAVNGKTLILTGIEPVARSDETREKGNMIKAVEPGAVRLGVEAARIMNAKQGDTITLASKVFVVEGIVPANGTEDDFRVYVNLRAAQTILDKPGVINGIVAFECLSAGSLEQSERYQSVELGKILPGYQHITKMNIAKGRFLGRVTTSSFLASLLIVLLIVTVLVIVIVGLQEVAERKTEIGIMISMGASYRFVAGLFLAKIILLAIVGASLGFVTGGYLSVWLTSPALIFNTEPIAIQWDNLPKVLVMAGLIAAVAETIPIAKLLRLDPGAILMEE